MQNIFDIVILQKSQALPDKLRETLRNRGYTSHTTFNALSTLAKVEELGMAVVLLDCGDKPGVLAKLLAEIKQSPDLCLYPCLIYAHQAKAEQEAAGLEFLDVSISEAPQLAPALIDLIGEFEDRYQEYIKKLKERAPNRVPSRRVTPQAIPAHPAFLNKAAQTSLLVEGNKHFIKGVKSLGGSLYSSKIDLEFLKSRRLLPNHRPLRDFIDVTLTKFPTKLQGGLFRRVYFGGASSNALVADENLREITVGAAFGMALGFSENPSNYTINYLNPNFPEIRSRISKIVRDSARQARSHKCTDVADFLNTAASLIEQSRSSGDDSNAQMVSLVVASDLADRASFYLGSWNPQAAYIFINQMLGGGLINLHPVALSATLRFLIEASSSRKPAHLLTKQIRLNPAFKEAHNQARKPILENLERKIELPQLSPGMRLSRSIFGYDGMLLMPKDTTLDADLILRIWHLGLIKILNTPVVIYA